MRLKSAAVTRHFLQIMQTIGNNLQCERTLTRSQTLALVTAVIDQQLDESSMVYSVMSVRRNAFRISVAFGQLLSNQKLKLSSATALALNSASG
jgi:hypothetical protein